MATKRFSGKQNSCPACGSHHGSCKPADKVPEGILCMFPESASSYWEKRGKGLKDGMGHVLQPYYVVEEAKAKWTKEQQEEYEREQKILAQYLAEQWAKKIKATDSLDLEDRDRIFRKFLSDKKLKDTHRQDLTKRGLSDAQIVPGMFRSTSYGMICPIWYESLIIGFQWKPDDPTDGKYLWHGDGKPTTNHLSNGELPATLLGDHFEETLCLCEGVLKPFVAQSKLGGRWLGAPGGQFPPLLLKKVVEDTKTTEAILWADAGSRVNKDVKNNYRLLRDRLADLGIALKVADWGQWDDKANGLDCDELPNDIDIEFKDSVEFFGELPKIEFDPKTGERIYTEEERKTSQTKATLEDRYQKLTADLEKIISLNLKKSEVTARLGLIAQNYKLHSLQVNQIYNELLAETEQVEDRDRTSKEVDKLIKAQTEALDLFSILPPELACEIYNIAELQSTRPESFLTILLGVVSSLCKPNTMLKIHQNWDDISPNFFGAIVADPSQLKTPTLKAITGPLKVLEQKARDTQKEMMTKYQEDMARYEGLSPQDRRAEFPDGKPQEPRRRLIQVGNATLEGLRNQFAAHPDHGILWKVDELAGLLKGLNAYRGGKGNDNEELLQAYDGDYTPTLRAPGIVADIDRVSLGIVGTIQPKVLEELVGSDDDDSSGKWNRIGFCLQPLSAITRFPEPGEGAELAYQLTKLYERIDSFPAQQYTLSPSAYELFCKRNIELEQLRQKDPRPVMRVTWGKTRGRIGKIAVILHHLLAAENGTQPEKEIPDYTVQAAIAVADFYAGQIEALYSSMGNGEGLAAHLSKVIALSQTNGWIKASDVVRSMRRVCKSTATAKQWFAELEAMGKGSTRGEGRTLEFKFSEKVAKVDHKVDQAINFETHTISGFQKKVDQIDQIDHFPPNPENPLTEDLKTELEEVPSPSPQNSIYLADDQFDQFDQLCPQDPLGVSDLKVDHLPESDQLCDQLLPNATPKPPKHQLYATYKVTLYGITETTLQPCTIIGGTRDKPRIKFEIRNGKHTATPIKEVTRADIAKATKDMRKIWDWWYQLASKAGITELPHNWSGANVQDCCFELSDQLGLTLIHPLVPF